MYTLIKISMDNAAFDDDGPSFEVARILRDLAARIEEDANFELGYSRTLRDYNGNSVGKCRVES